MATFVRLLSEAELPPALLTHDSLVFLEVREKEVRN